MNALVKTVGSQHWRAQIEKLKAGTYKTPTSLPPPNGCGMSLYGALVESPAGLVWDAQLLDTSDGFIFPSGYYAKTEVGCRDGGNLGQVNVVNGQLSQYIDRTMLVGIEDLRQANQCIPEGDTAPFNELYIPVSQDALAAVFVRSLEFQHLLLAMGVVTLLEEHLKRTLPLLLLLPDRPAQVSYLEAMR